MSYHRHLIISTIKSQHSPTGREQKERCKYIMISSRLHCNTEYLQGLVMEFSEWMRIKDGLKKAEDEAKRREKKILEQKALHEMSKSLVKNWENTIEVLLTQLPW